MQKVNYYACQTPTRFRESERCSVTRLLTRPDIARIKQVLNVNSEQLADIFGVSPSLASGWVNCTRKPIGPARKLLLLVEQNPQIAELLKAL
ncbi:hypothetical protein C1Y41_04305 [Pantoea sp. ICBG 1758]|uniref:helix-turn-helix domain-containing protein n=1 Tax=Pantoea sp. ICBG 1758 TaxID=2071682 RepID=UPI000CE4760C|nr:hypothetical protein [Pantoea sp. ICBG 1758]PPC63873.1 hypothetical protein C1Y41_04305 [Pantoea sp. ICBG 1758]